MPDNQLQLLEARVLAGASSLDDWRRVETAGLQADDFEHYGPVFAYITGVVEQYRLLPRLRDLQETFNLPPGLQRSADQHAADVAEMARVVLTRKFQQTIGEVVQEHSDDPAEMLNEALQKLGQLSLGGAAAGSVSVIDQTSAARLARYKAMADELAARGAAMAGLPTGISHFDRKAKLGWLPGELIGVVARTFMGKTWLLMNFGVVAWMNGHKVLMVNPELSQEEAEARFDILLAAKHGIESVTLDALYRGVDPPPDFRQLLTDVAGRRQDWVTYTNMEGKAFSVADVHRLVRQHQPDLVVIDGLMLLRSPLRRAQIWEQVIDLCGGLKNMAQSERVPVIVAHQANRGAGNIYRPPKLSEIAGGDAFGWDCDRILALANYQVTEDEPDASQFLRVTIQKFRKGQALPAGVRFRFEPGKGQVYEDPEQRRIRTSGDAGDNGEGEQRGNEHPAALSLP